MKVAILDDYQNVAFAMADWSSVAEITVFNDHVADPFSLIGAIEIERRPSREYRSRTPDQSDRRIPRRDVNHVDADDSVSRSERSS
jgi:hypothetical protein